MKKVESKKIRVSILVSDKGIEGKKKNNKNKKAQTT